MGLLKRKENPAVVCDRCRRPISRIRPKHKKVGEIEYSYWQCRHCKAVYVIFATDEALRQKVQQYQDLLGEYYNRQMPAEVMQRLQLMLETNVKRSREIRQQYPLVL